MATLFALFLSGFVIGSRAPIIQATAAMRLASIRVNGNQRYTLDDVEKLSGLQIGQSIAVPALNDAAGALAKTGLFSNVKYTYTSAGTQLTVTFEIEEAPATVPVIFDNFVWISDDELKMAVRSDVPEFDGKTTRYAGAPELIARGLQDILAERHLPGHVSVMPQFPITGAKAEPTSFIFSVNDPAPQLCALHVAGASAIPEKDLSSQLQGTIGGPYSREFLKAASEGTLTDMYHRVGHWRAVFESPTVALTECSGVAVTLHVNEGAAYVWDHADWTGNAALESSALDKLLPLKSGETASGAKIAAGLIAIEAEYDRHGYLEENASYEPRLDDSTHRATFLMKVQEGPQYTMGTLEVVGIRQADADKLQKQWRLKQGDVFDKSYLKTYQSDVLSALQSPAGQRPTLGTTLDREHHVANVRIFMQ